MNKIFIGLTKTVEPPERGLFIHDDVPAISRARTFDPTKHSFNPLKDINYRKACDFVDIIDALFPRGDGTLTKDTGLEFIATALEAKPKSLEHLIIEPDRKASPGHIWAYNKIARILRSPVLKRVLCSPTNQFSFDLNKHPNRQILARINRAEIGDFDALVLGLFLIGHFKGQIVIPDFGFYGRDAHVSLIREERLIAGVNFLSELTPKLRNSVVLIPDKTASGATYNDAVLLAQIARLHPDPTRKDNDYNAYIDQAMNPLEEA